MPRTDASRVPAGPHRDPGPASWSDVLASLSDAIVVTDAAGRVIDGNPAAEGLLRTGIAHLVGAPLDEARLGLRGDTTWLRRLVDLTLTDAQTHRATAAALGSAEGTVEISASCSPVRDPSGLIVGTVLVLHDLSLQRALDTTERHHERLAAMALVTAGLAHEIRNPLGGIKGAAQLLRADLHDPDHIRCTELIVREVDRLSGLVERLRDLGDDTVPAFGPVNIHRVIDDVLTLLQRAPSWGSTTLRRAYDPSLPPVHGDRAQLTQVVLNLAKNALEAHGERGGLLTVTTRIETGYHLRHGHERRRFLSFAVDDSGPGIPEADRPRLFAPFFTTKAHGTGLGLAVCQRIIHAHAGTIVSEDGRHGGARFRVLLPVSEVTLDPED